MTNVLFIDVDVIACSANDDIVKRLACMKDKVPFMHYVLLHEKDTYGSAKFLLQFFPEADIIYRDSGAVKTFLESKKSKSNDGIGTFAFILSKQFCDDMSRDFPNNVVKCDGNVNGLTENKIKEAEWIMTNFGRDRQSAEKKVFFTSDTHFFHTNIIKYCSRPFKDVDEMNAELISRWNAVVGKDDIVWHLGDFAFGNKNHVSEILPKLNGNINLVMGNHDLRNKQAFYLHAGFKHVYDRPVIWHNFFILSHEPLQWVSNDGVYANVFGHVHDSNIYRTFTARSACVCVERFNYAPVLWEDIASSMKRCEGSYDIEDEQ